MCDITLFDISSSLGTEWLIYVISHNKNVDVFLKTLVYLRVSASMVSCQNSDGCVTRELSVSATLICVTSCANMLSSDGESGVVDILSDPY